MKKRNPLFLIFLTVFTILPEIVYAKKTIDVENSIAGEIQVLGINPMGAPFINGQTNVSMDDGTLFMDTATGGFFSTVFTIENLSFIDDLNISSITISGTNAGDFAVEGIPPSQIGVGMSDIFMVNFTPQSVGTKNATVTIVSDDPANGTFTFAIQGTAFEGGTGLHFDGVDDYITFLNGNYSLGPNFTMELWIQPEISGMNEYYILDTQNGAEGHGLYIDFMSQLNFVFYTSSGIKILTSTSTITNQWQHIGITYDGANYKMYINGIEDASLTLSEALIDTTDNLRLGGFASGGQPYAGAMDELRIWNTAFSNCRIASQLNCELAGDETNLEAYYNFNNGIANGNNFPIYMMLDPNHTITSGIPPQGTLFNFGLTGTTSNWIDTSANGISGTCNTYNEPEITIVANNITIANGSAAITVANNTFLGNVELGQAEPADYTISNNGNDPLNISSVIINGATDFTIIEAPTQITAGNSANLRILFTPATSGDKNATVQIANNTCNDPFTFAIQGRGFIPGTGLNFDGVDDMITIDHNNTFNDNTFTIEGSFKTSSTTDEQAIISKYSGNGFSVQITDAGRMKFKYQVSNINATSVSNTSGLNDGTWHHFAIVFGNDKVIYYIDGSLDVEYTYSSSPDAPTNTEDVLIGYSEFSNQYFEGDLDEIRFWSREICLDELNAQRLCELSGNETGLLFNYNFNQGMIGLDNTSVQTVLDTSSNSFNGTLTNFALNGTTSNWIDATANNISGSCSIAIPEINVQGNGIDIINGDTTPDSSDNTDAGTISIGNSAEMSFFIRNTNGTGDLNVSGVFLSGDTNDFSITQSPINNPILATESASLTINFSPTSNGIKTVVVTIDSDDCDEPFYTFTIQGKGVGPATGLDFDGTDDLITIPHDISQNNLNFSVDFWIKTTDGLGGVINKFTPDGNNGWRINLDGGRIEFYYYASAFNHITRLLSPATSVNDGNWHHVAVTLDAGGGRCYIDGSLARTTGWNGTATATTTTTDIQIGYAAADSPTGDSGGYFDGQLDELRIWTKTLSAFEIETLNGCTADMVQPDLLASYNFNQGTVESDNSSETTLIDSAGNNFNGTLSNFTLNGTTSNWIDASANNVSGSCECVVAGGVTLTTQVEVDSYITTLSTCGIIEGNVIINGMITDLSGFSNIHTISGDLYLEGNIVDDLSGFSSLTSIGGNFTLKDMPNTTSITAFSNVTNLGGNFEVNNLDQLTDISILDQVTSISRITIVGNAMLSMVAFNELQSIDSNFSITFNGALSSISVPKLTQISSEFRMNNNGSGMTDLNVPLLESTGTLIIADMGGLQSISAPELLTVTSNFSIGSCSALTTLTFPKLVSIQGNASFNNCTLLDTITLTALTTIGGNLTLDDLIISSLDFLEKVTSISGGLSLTDLSMLNNLLGMDDLATLGSFNLTNCDNVLNLEGFPNLNITSLNSLNISGNESITSLSNTFLESITTMESLGISFNGNLIEIDALQNLVSLTDTNNSTIRNNNNLQSINMYALRNVTANLIIQNQEEGITSLCGLYDYVTIGDGATTLSFFGANDTDWDSVQDILDNCNAAISPKAFLQGAALNPNLGEESFMRDDLRVNGLIPVTSPYSDGLMSNPAVFNNTGGNAIVDWVWLELRDATDNTMVVASRSALLQRDGDIVHTDGVSPLYFSTTAGDYFVVVQHRSHLGIISANAITLSTAISTVDFSSNTTSISGGANALIDLGSGIFGIPVGDFDDNGQVQSADLNSVRLQLGMAGYMEADMDMNGEIQTIDINSLLIPNIGKGSQLD